jgi:alginate O-acetyltransferase complex protein AlgI
LLFISSHYLIFFLSVFLLYWFCCSRSKTLQNALLLAASYFFYGMWDWRFLSLILLSSATDYLAALGIVRAASPRGKKSLLAFSLIVNLGILFFFKYFSFFHYQLVRLLDTVGLSCNPLTLQIVLPVGISFYTFQSIGYTVDVYRGRQEPTRSALDFFTYIAFFPQLVAGPIERAHRLLPQLRKRRVFHYPQAVTGCRLIAWGIFKKAVVADNCALLVDYLFARGDFSSVHPFLLLAGAFFFAFQIYCDFSGYSDIAIGSARLLGVELMTNFRFPYLAPSIPEFWRRWHISLTSWFRDYVYIPMGGSRETLPVHVRNILLVFIVSAFWHGANWTFFLWGCYSAACFLIACFLARQRIVRTIISAVPAVTQIARPLSIAMTFCVIGFGWILFRSPDVPTAADYLFSLVQGLFSAEAWQMAPDLLLTSLPKRLQPAVINSGLSILILMAAEVYAESRTTPVKIPGGPVPAFVIYNLLFLLILFVGRFNHQEFIYFQF